MTDTDMDTASIVGACAKDILTGVTAEVKIFGASGELLISFPADLTSVSFYQPTSQKIVDGKWVDRSPQGEKRFSIEGFVKAQA